MSSPSNTDCCSCCPATEHTHTPHHTHTNKVADPKLAEVLVSHQPTKSIVERLEYTPTGGANSGPSVVRTHTTYSPTGGESATKETIQSTIGVNTVLLCQGIFSGIAATQHPNGGFRWETQDGHVLRVWDGGVETYYADGYVVSPKGDGYSYWVATADERDNKEFPDFDELEGTAVVYYATVAGADTDVLARYVSAAAYKLD